jgi:FimV-like protein
MLLAMLFTERFDLVTSFVQQWMNDHLSNPHIRYSLIAGLMLSIVTIVYFAIYKRKPGCSDDSSADFASFSGDDLIATQLDLAKAYIEMNEAKLAKQILSKVIKSGSAHQQSEARQLIESV